MPPPHADDRHSLILCASLVQNPMNLGALCRTAEVLRLQSLVLPRQDVVADRAFRKLAVSAQHWQPLSVCPPDALADWLVHMAGQGYTVLALTRHPEAVPLPQAMFPKRTVLLLGRELTGIPADLLQICAAAIAIPQFGQVESLNVQTAAAIASYAYLCQHAIPPSF